MKIYWIFSIPVFALIMLTGCPGPAPTALPPVEIREYQGENLSSVNDFRENSIRGPQEVDMKTYRLTVDGLVVNPKVYTYDEVIAGYPHYTKVLKLDCVEGWSVKLLWEGMLVREILATSQVKPEAKTVIFHCYDGYTTSMPVEYFTQRDILIAYKMNEVNIPEIRGFPFMLVAEDKWGYKWAKWITRIELSSDVNYQGYWESRGYSSSGDLQGPIFQRD